MRILTFSKFWLSQFCHSAHREDALPYNDRLFLPAARKLNVSLETFTWSSGSVFSLIAFHFRIKRALLYFLTHFRYKSLNYPYTTSVAFLDKAFYFSNMVFLCPVPLKFEVDTIDSSVLFNQYLLACRTVSIRLLGCTSYKIVDLVSAPIMLQTRSSTPEVFWNFYIFPYYIFTDVAASNKLKPTSKTLLNACCKIPASPYFS